MRSVSATKIKSKHHVWSMKREVCISAMQQNLMGDRNALPAWPDDLASFILNRSSKTFETKEPAWISSLYIHCLASATEAGKLRSTMQGVHLYSISVKAMLRQDRPRHFRISGENL